MEKRIKYLLQKFGTDNLNEIEKQELLVLVEAESASVGKEISEMIDVHEQTSIVFHADEKWNKVLHNILATDKVSGTRKRKLVPFVWWTVAAAVLIVLSFGLFINNKPLDQPHLSVFKEDVDPGSNKAILILGNGKKISLTDANNGDIEKQAGISITKTADGQLIYTVSKSENQEDENKVNTISTPKGGQWQIRLADGTMVWLNASSSLTYPLSFSSLKQRKVELDGEAYFEVAKDKTRPFIVHTDKQEVEVLGTHFNINSYADELFTKTTLLEGSIRVSHNQTHETEILKPGEQSILSKSGINVSSVDVEEAVAWKNGYFMFNNEKQESIMRKISRWYNVEVEYKDASAKDVMYYGTVGRFEKVSKVLRKFEQTGEVRFELIDNKIIVHKEYANK